MKETIRNNFSSLVGKIKSSFNFKITIHIFLAALMGVVIMTTHWEAITYSQSAVESLLSVEDPENKTLVRPLLDGRVIVVSKENDKENELLVKMHAGLWATCYDLTGK